MADDTPLSAQELATMRATTGWTLLPRRLLATIAAVERERDEALARIARVEALCDESDAWCDKQARLYSGEHVPREWGTLRVPEVRTALAATNPSGGAE